MKVDGRPYRSIWLDQDGLAVVVIDQTRLPHSFGTRRLNTVEDAADAIRTMVVRGAPLIGATAAYGLALALADDPRGCEPGERHHAPVRNPADGGQPALGAGGSRPEAPPFACPRPRRRCLPAGRRHLR